MRRILKLSFVLASVLSLVGCKPQEESNIIYTSFYPLYDFTKRIVGDRYEVRNLTPAGSEPHDYEPTAREVVGMTAGKALFLNGLGLESWSSSLPDMLEEKTFTASEGIPTMKIGKVTDPHVWLNPLYAVKEMENIKNSLAKIDEENAPYFEENFEAAKKEFVAMDQEFERTAKTFKNRYLVVSHAAFGYLAERYSLTQIYVSGLSPDQEPTPIALERIVEEVKKYQINTIYYEELVSPSISEKIAEEAGVRTDTLNPLEGLTEEELQTEDYLSVSKENFQKLIRSNS